MAITRSKRSRGYNAYLRAKQGVGNYPSDRYPYPRPPAPPLPVFKPSPPCGLTEEELLIACRNVGVNLECGRVASIFYTGASNVECDCGGCHVPQLEVEYA